jgi:hypothetical protein
MSFSGRKKMIVTTRKETFYKIEMTTEQAHELDWFLDHLQERQFDEVASMAGCNATEQNSMQHTLADFHAALKDRHGT